MEIKKRLQINVAVSAITALVIIFMLFLTLYRINRAVDASDLADEIIRGVFERSTFEADYLRTHSERARVQWLSKNEKIGRLLRSASGSFKEPEDQVNIEGMLKDHEAIGRLFSSVMKNRGRIRSDSDPTALSLEIENRLLTQLTMRSYEMVLHARRLQEAGTKSLFSILKIAGWGIFLVIALVTAAAIINLWTGGRIITSRIGRLRDSVSVIGEGNLDYRIEIKGDDEFTELSKAFNTMTAQLKNSYLDLENEIVERKRMEEELRQARDGLELRVAERTAEMEQANETLRNEINERKKIEQALRESESQLRLLPSRLIAVQEEERKRLGVELHDSIGQTLVALKFNVEAVLYAKDHGETEQAFRLLERFVPTLQHAIAEIRSIYMGLRPTMLGEIGVLATLRWLGKEFKKLNPKQHLDLVTAIEEEEIPEPLKIVIFRISQEALNNVARHSQAEQADLLLVKKGDGIELTIADNGRGLDVNRILSPGNSVKTLGLVSIRERVQLTRGSLSIESSPGAGTTIRVFWPEGVEG